jgi:hypothetical protein
VKAASKNERGGHDESLLNNTNKTKVKNEFVFLVEKNSITKYVMRLKKAENIF